MNDAKEKFADKALLWRSITMKLVDINIQFAVRTEALKAAVIKKKATAVLSSHQLSDIKRAGDLLGLDTLHKDLKKKKKSSKPCRPPHVIHSVCMNVRTLFCPRVVRCSLQTKTSFGWSQNGKHACTQNVVIPAAPERTFKTCLRLLCDLRPWLAGSRLQAVLC